jgi:hypothetical protein
MLWLISQRQLLPGIVIMGSFILFVLWTVGLIVISVQLWGPSGSVNANCQLFINTKSSTGANTDTLAWLEQHSICTSIFPLFCYWIDLCGIQCTAKQLLTCPPIRPELDSSMGFRARRSRVPLVDDDHGIPSLPPIMRRYRRISRGVRKHIGLGTGGNAYRDIGHMGHMGQVIYTGVRTYCISGKIRCIRVQRL